MSYYGRRRRPSPYAEERRERERETRERLERDKAALTVFLATHHKTELRGNDAALAWKAPSVRTFTTAILADGSHVTWTVREDSRGQYLQEPGHMGWTFYRLTAK